MKKQTISYLLIAFAMMFVLSSCGDKTDDPQPVVKTDLQKVQEAVSGSTWVLISADVVTNGKTYHYNGDCNFSVFNDLGDKAAATSTNTVDFTYIFNGISLSYTQECGSQTGTNIPYTIAENSGKFTLTYKHGTANVIFELVTPVDELKTATSVTVKLLTLNAGATSSTLVYKKS